MKDKQVDQRTGARDAWREAEGEDKVERSCTVSCLKRIYGEVRARPLRSAQWKDKRCGSCLKQVSLHWAQGNNSAQWKWWSTRQCPGKLWDSHAWRYPHLPREGHEQPCPALKLALLLARDWTSRGPFQSHCLYGLLCSCCSTDFHKCFPRTCYFGVVWNSDV